MDMRKVISAIVVAVVLVVGATVAYMYIADVGVFDKKEEKEVKDIKESTLGEFGDDVVDDKETDKEKDSTDDGSEDSETSDEDKNSDIVSALDSEEDTEVEVSNVEVTEGKDGKDRVTADTSNGNSIDVFVPGQSIGGEPVVSEDKPKEKDRELVSSGDNKYTDKVKNDVIKAGAVYIGESDGSFSIIGNGITHDFSINSVDNYKFSYLLTRVDSTESMKLAISNMIKLGVGASENNLVSYINKSINGDYVDEKGIFVTSDGIATVVRWN